MSAQFSLTTLLGAVVRGLRARASLTAGSIVLAAVAIASAVLGPAYQSASSQSFLVARLNEAPPVSSGVSVTYEPTGALAASYHEAYEHASGVGAQQLDGLFEAAKLSLESRRDNVGRVFGLPANYGGSALLMSKDGACEHLKITGSCPSRPGDVIMLGSDAAPVHVKVGDTLAFKSYPGELHVVGLYSVPNDPAGFWFDESRLFSQPPFPGPTGLTFNPAPLVTDPSTFEAMPPGSWKVNIDRFLTVNSDIAPDDVSRAHQAVVDLPKQLADEPGGSYRVTRDNSLQTVIAEIDQNRDTARKTVTPAVVSLVLVALALLVRLLGAAADQRRNELALGSMRGMSGRQMWAFGLAEPVTLLLLAAPIGLALGYGAAVWLSRLWLIEGIEVSLGWWSIAAAALVLGVALLASVFTVSRALSEPLSTQLAGVRRPERSTRWALVAKMVLVVAAVVAVAASLSAKGRSDPDTSDLVLPLLLAGATGLLITAATVAVAGWWSRRTSRRRGITGFVASRAVSRRREGSLVILPLTAALAISVFAAGVFGAASTWRASTAATRVGADQAYRSPLTMAETVSATHAIDPDGRWLMAAGVISQGEYGDKLVLDTPRLARVGVWPGTWTPGIDASGVADLLGPQSPGVRVQGGSFSMTLDHEVDSPGLTLGVSLQVMTAEGKLRTMFFGPFKRGESESTTEAAFCQAGCVVRTLLIGGPATTSVVLNGTVTVTGFTADGQPVDSMVDATEWRPVTSPLGLAPNTTSINEGTSTGLSLNLDSQGQNALGGVTPSDVPEYRPVLMGRGQDTEVIGGSGDHLVAKTEALEGLPIQPVAETESMPFVGPRGFAIDYTMLSRDQDIPEHSTDVYVLARGDMPSTLTAALNDLGVFDRTELSSAQYVLDQDAYALSLNLYLVTALAAVALALAGLAVNMAVQMPERRRDAASLRVVGVRRRQILRAVFVEISAVLGAAGLAGIIAGSAAQYIVVRTVTLGFAGDIRTPRVVATLDTQRVGIFVGVVLLVLVGVATCVAALAVQRARASTLRGSVR